MEDRCTLKFQKSHKLTKNLGNKFWHVHKLDIFFRVLSVQNITPQTFA